MRHYLSTFIILEENLQASLHDSHVSPLCSCQTTKASEIDIANIELQRVSTAVKSIYILWSTVSKVSENYTVR